MYRCESGNVSVGWLGLKHNDQVIVSVVLQNGGYLVYENRNDRYKFSIEKKWPANYVSLIGIETTETYKFHWDTVLPYYDCSKWSCPSVPVYVPDVSKTSMISIHWNIWSDDLSEIDYYDIEVFEMHHVGNSTDNNEIVEIMEPRVHQPRLKKLESTINVTVPGMYAVHFTAFDRAGNYKSARGLFLYDNNEDIELGRGSIEVIQAKNYSEKGWITYPSSRIHVTWKDMFVKTDHLKHNWLAKVKKFDHIESSYDDNSGKRTIEMVPNVKGIVKFDIAHDVYGPSNKSSSPFTLVSDVYAEMAVQNVAWDDGNKLIVTIRAIDLLENYRDEIVTVYKDATPPIISNLWLTKGDRINIAVHSVEEFNDMIIEWDAFDYHSGISHLNWKLYDNFTGSDIIHGEIDLPGQGKTESLKECEEKYVDYKRGPACYCTHYTGCYHKHFHIKPHVAVGNETGNGIVHNRSMGVHESDYFIDVNVTNMATLTTMKTIKITIDITPPEPGHVHDGIYGFPEIDYQQDLQLDAYWEGFFDHESGVAFYQYKFATTCLTKEDFKNKNMASWF
ncbi:uncharacterized protein LOC127721009 [Mytilus californianus]|uniref:uncharacterized protein LOC127721009 n=1 Tax=Mytilus californianus TaxID=6549 RepID=UPI0022471E38|nr:uncharacterized protein LOC127721009 [Mytilus californianus]